jgi:predicted negative regulator of RcsB-dependent stress response
LAKKYTRKQLRQPDEFITMSHRAMEYVVAHLKLVLVALVVAAVIIGAAWTWTWYRERSARDATAMLSRAIDMYTQMIIPGDKSKLKPREDGIPHFDTRAAKLKATAEELTKAVQQHEGNSVGRLARLMRAAVRYDEGKYADAAQDYEAFLAGGGEERFKTTAIEGLIYSYEAQKQWDKALAQVKKLPATGDERFAALYHEGRILAAQGKKQEAAERFKQVVQKATSSSLSQQAGQRLALLEAR